MRTRAAPADLRRDPITDLKYRDLMEIHDKIPSVRPKCKCGVLRGAPGRRMNKRGSQHEGFHIVGVPAHGAVLVPPGIVIAARATPSRRDQHHGHRPAAAPAASAGGPA